MSEKKARVVFVSDTGNKNTPFDGIAYVYSEHSPKLIAAKINGDKLTAFREILSDEPNESDAQRFMRKCVKLTEELERVKAERDEYKRALEFYAELTSWYDPREINGSEQNGIWNDSENILIKSNEKYLTIGGRRAREVLEKWESKE